MKKQGKKQAEIARFLNVSAEYHVTGNVAEKMIENSREQELLTWYRKLSPEKQDAFPA